MTKFKLSEIKNLVNNDLYYSNNREIIAGNKKITIHVDNDIDFAYHDFMDFKDFILAGYTRNYNLNETSINDKPSSLDDLKEALNEAYDIYCILPLFKYEHGGILLSVNDFNDQWDSGCIGYVFMTKDQAKSREIKDLDEAKSFIKNGLEYINKLNNEAMYSIQLIDLKRCDHCNSVDEVDHEYMGSYFSDDLEAGIIDAVGVDNIDMNA